MKSRQCRILLAVCCVCALSCFVYVKKPHADQIAREGTQILVLASQVAEQIDTYKQLLLNIQNTAMAVIDWNSKPEDIIKAFDVYNKLKNAGEDVIGRLDEMIEFFPGREELLENMGFSADEIAAFRDYYEEKYKEWTDKADNELKDNFGMSLATFEKMKKERQEEGMKQYFKSLQGSCDDEKGTNCLLGVGVEQNYYQAELIEDLTMVVASQGKAFSAYQQKIAKHDQIAVEKHKRETDMSGWSEISKGSEHEKLGPSWRN